MVSRGTGGEIVLYQPGEGPALQEMTRTVGEVLELHGGILFSWIYGSYARQEPFQDIDIAIYLAQAAEPYDIYKLQMQIAREVEQRVIPGIPVDVRILNGAPVEFQYEVIRDGRLAYERDRELRIEFESGVMSRYLDIRFMLDRVDRAFLAGVGR